MLALLRARDENGVLRAVAYAGSSIIYICNYAFWLAIGSIKPLLEMDGQHNNGSFTMA